MKNAIQCLNNKSAEIVFRKSFWVFLKMFSEFEQKFLGNFETWRKITAGLTKPNFTYSEEVFEETLIWKKSFLTFFGLWGRIQQ